MEKLSRKASWKQRGMQHNGNASWKAILVGRHGKSVMECITETVRHAASRKGVMQIGSCGASRNSCHGMRNGKHQRSQNVSLSECHGKVVMDGFMECNTYGTSRKGRRHGNQYLLSVTEKVSRKASWKQGRAQRHEKASWKAILVERHGKAVMECVMETARCVASRKGVTEINICLASRKRRHGKHHGDSKVRSVMERRYGKRYWWSVMEKAVMECITETARRAASRKGVTEINRNASVTRQRHTP